MANKEKVKEMFKDLMTRLYVAKGFNSLSCDPLERNIFEAEMQDMWDEFDSHVVLYKDDREEYEEEIEDLEENLSYVEGQLEELTDKNCELREENKKLWSRIQEISKVVNDTWN